MLLCESAKKPIPINVSKFVCVLTFFNLIQEYMIPHMYVFPRKTT